MSFGNSSEYCSELAASFLQGHRQQLIALEFFMGRNSGLLLHQALKIKKLSGGAGLVVGRLSGVVSCGAGQVMGQA